MDPFISFGICAALLGISVMCLVYIVFEVVIRFLWPLVKEYLKEFMSD